MLPLLESDLRPVNRGHDPFNGQISRYEDAKTDLIRRIAKGQTSAGHHLGSYCSYCERKISTGLAVEHIEPKGGQHGQPHLINEWSNFLLACTNCNSTKGDKKVAFSDLFFPDRDNTFYAFQYNADGTIEPNPNLSGTPLFQMAQETLKLVGLDRPTPSSLPSYIALERVGQRMQAWGQAVRAKEIYLTNTNNQLMIELIVAQMINVGFFSVWMTVFNNVPDMKIAFIRAISGTEDSGCFDMTNGNAITPHPNADGLSGGGKI
jgi:uncharacterized protein (TIGR02646 family)